MAIIIGIGGVSRSGKTFLAGLISSHYDSAITIILPQDDFVKPTHLIPLIKDHVDWESPESIDFPLFKNAIISASGQSDIVIAEGLLSFFHPEVTALFNKKIFINLSFAEFKHRKQSDMRWGKEPGWYMQHIWDSYREFGQIDTHLPGTLFIDGGKEFDINEIMKFINI